MSASEEARTEAAPVASDDSEEKDVKIPVQGVDDEVAAEPEVEAVEAEVVEPEATEAAEPAHEMTEEEMVEAAIRAGEEAANDDFKVKYEQVCAELAEVRSQLEAAGEAQKAAEDKAAEAVDRATRLQADWENFRRRTASERLAEKERAAEKLVLSLLPVLDDMERAIEHAGNTEENEQLKQFVDGIGAVHQKMLTALQKEGVEVIDPAGEAFEPLSHQAVGRVEDAEAYDETVAQVYQKGYKMGDKVIRTAMVTVTFGGPKRPAPEPADAAPADGDN